jgi:hypothetical protein
VPSVVYFSQLGKVGNKIKKHHRRRYYYSDSDEEDDGEGGQGEGEDDDDEEGMEGQGGDQFDEGDHRRHRHRRKQGRHHSHRAGRHHHNSKSATSGADADKDMASAAAAAKEEREITAAAEAASKAAKGPPAEVRKAKTFNSSKQTTSSEKDTQTAPVAVGAANVSTNTDKIHASSVSTNTNTDAEESQGETGPVSPKKASSNNTGTLSMPSSPSKRNAAAIAAATSAATVTFEEEGTGEGRAPVPAAGSSMPMPMTIEQRISGDHVNMEDFSLGESFDSVDSYTSDGNRNGYSKSGRYHGLSPREADLATLAQLQQVAQVALEAKNMNHSLRSELNKRTEEIEESIESFKRIAFMLQDMKLNYDLLKTKVDGISLSSNHESGNFDELRAASQYHSIQQTKNLWARLHAELLYALEKRAESTADDEEDDDDASTTTQLKAKKDGKEFSKRATALIGYLDINLAAFHPAESVPQTLKSLQPILENIYKQARELDALDDQIRTTTKQIQEGELSQKSPSLGESKGIRSPGRKMVGGRSGRFTPAPPETCFFDTLTCSDQSTSLKKYLQEAMVASVPVLDESIPKVAMRQRIDLLERVLREKADKAELKAIRDEIATLQKLKVDIKDFQASISKYATAAELTKLSTYVSDLGGRGSGSGYANANANTGQGSGSFDVQSAPLQLNPEFQGLLHRFEMLGKQQLDLHNFCNSFVPREEVHEAMKAVISEVKTLKKNTINHSIFRDGLKMKADTSEVERYVRTVEFFLKRPVCVVCWSRYIFSVSFTKQASISRYILTLPLMFNFHVGVCFSPFLHPKEWSRRLRRLWEI